MELSVWLAFVAAATVVLVVPGPTILMIISLAISHGRKASTPLILGVAFGDVIAITLSLLGLGAILMTSAWLFMILKWAGAAYLFYLGIQMWRTKDLSIIDPPLSKKASKKSKEIFWQACLVTALNPKGIMFFIAFMPQFVTPDYPAKQQLLILAVTFMILTLLNSVAFTVFAVKIRSRFTRPSAVSWFNKGSGSALIGAGLVTAAMER